MYSTFCIAKVFPLALVIRDYKERVKLAKLCKIVSNGVNGAVVFFFNFLHFVVKLGFLINPKAAKHFKEAYLIFLLKAVYVRLVNIHLLQNLNTFYFSFFVCHNIFSLNFIFYFFKFVTDFSECFFKSKPSKQVHIKVAITEGIFIIPFISKELRQRINTRIAHIFV